MLSRQALNAKTMQQEVKEAPIDAEAAQLKRAGDAEVAPHRRDSAALWRAMAGMAISLALACLIVMLELTGQAAHRADRMHRHAEALRSRVSRLESEIADERARIATAHRELAAAEELRAILRAPDAAMLPLAPGARAAGARGSPAARASRRPQATLALAPREHRAVLIVAGLKSGSERHALRALVERGAWRACAGRRVSHRGRRQRAGDGGAAGWARGDGGDGNGRARRGKRRGGERRRRLRASRGDGADTAARHARALRRRPRGQREQRQRIRGGPGW